MNPAPKPIPAAALHRFKEALVFNVTHEETRDGLDGLPGIKSTQHGRRNAYTWTLPALGLDYDFGIGWEMGLAYLRAHAWEVGLDNPEAFDGGGGGSLPFVAEAMFNGHACEGHRGAFFHCLATFHDYALNAPPQVMAALVGRLLVLDDAALRARCLAILDGEPVADIFAPEGLGWPAGDPHRLTPTPAAPILAVLRSIPQPGLTARKLKGGQPPLHAAFSCPFRLAMPPVSAGQVGRPSGLPVPL